jgi:hypothetical protein
MTKRSSTALLSIALVLISASSRVTATEAVMPAVDAAGFVGIWEGIAYSKDVGSDSLFIVRLRAACGGRGSLEIAEMFQEEAAVDEAAKMHVIHFDLKAWSAKGGHVQVQGTSKDDYYKTLALTGFGKAIPGHGRLDVTLVLKNDQGEGEPISAVLVQDDNVHWLTRMESRIRRFRTKK